MVTVHALGALGKGAAALAALDGWEIEMDRPGASRFNGRSANFPAWVLRGLGATEQAHE
jgi:hypothetical protein